MLHLPAWSLVPMTLLWHILWDRMATRHRKWPWLIVPCLTESRRKCWVKTRQFAQWLCGTGGCAWSQEHARTNAHMSVRVSAAFGPPLQQSHDKRKGTEVYVLCICGWFCYLTVPACKGMKDSPPPNSQYSSCPDIIYKLANMHHPSQLLDQK